VSGKHRGQGFLYIVNAKTGKLIQKIGTEAGTADTPSGLGQGTAYIQQTEDFTADQFYAGDLRGNLWRFDLSVKKGKYPNAIKMAALTDSSGKPQPISIAPQVAIGRNHRDRWVLVGTGKELTSADTKDPQQQTMYAIRDGSKEAPAAVTKALTRSQLKVVTDLTAGAAVSDKVGLYDLTGGSAAMGREKITVDVEAQGDIVSFIGKSPSSDPCAPAGTSNIYVADIETGATVLRSETGKPEATYRVNSIIGSALVSVNGKPAIVLTDAEGKHRVLPMKLLIPVSNAMNP
jgi:type IV pilus assembly protein PilY1